MWPPKTQFGPLVYPRSKDQGPNPAPKPANLVPRSPETRPVVYSASWRAGTLTATDLDRPQYACVTCRPPKNNDWTIAEHGWRICDGCFHRLEATLTEINERYFLLDASPGGGQSDGRGSPGFGSKPPCNLSVLVIRDHRSSQVAKAWVGRDGRVHREDESPGMSAWGVLSTWVTDVCELRRFELQGRTQYVHNMCRWLITQLDWIARQESVAEFFEDVTRLVRQLRPMTGERRVRIGLCDCGKWLYAPVSGGEIVCSGCDATWSGAQWVELASQLDAC